MKKTDVAMIILIASVGVLVAFFSAKAIFGDVYNGKTTIKTIDLISSEITQPSTEVFNEGSINPTIKVEVSGTSSGN